MPEVVVRSLFAYAAWLSHNLPAFIAKILDHRAAAMFSGMLRPHFCDVAVASHRAQVMFASAHAHANRHEQCAMASDQRTNRRWKSSAPHKTSMVVAMHSNLGRFVLVDLLLGARQCGFPWVSFVCGQHLVVSSTAFMDSCKFAQAHCNDHTSAGRHCAAKLSEKAAPQIQKKGKKHIRNWLPNPDPFLVPIWVPP